LTRYPRSFTFGLFYFVARILFDRPRRPVLGYL
jgi:hypothetical protein